MVEVPESLEVLGRRAWLSVGIAVALTTALLVAGMISNRLIPLIFAAILAGIFVPVVDRLERAHVPRGLGAPLVVGILLTIGVAICWVVVERESSDLHDAHRDDPGV